MTIKHAKHISVNKSYKKYKYRNNNYKLTMKAKMEGHGV